MSLKELEEDQARELKKLAHEEVMANAAVKELIEKQGAKLREIKIL